MHQAVTRPLGSHLLRVNMRERHAVLLYNHMSKDVFCFTFSMKNGIENVQVKVGRSDYS